MAVVPGLIVAIAFLLLSNFDAVLQEKTRVASDDPPAADVQVKGLQLVASTEKSAFSTDEPIVLKVAATNNSARPVFIVDTYHSEWDTKFHVENEAGVSVALTEEGKRLTGSIAIFRQIRVEIHLGDEVKEHFTINNLFDMTSPGTYSITVKRSSCFTGTEVFMVATSNTVKVTVAVVSNILCKRSGSSSSVSF